MPTPTPQPGPMRAFLLRWLFSCLIGVTVTATLASGALLSSEAAGTRLILAIGSGWLVLAIMTPYSAWLESRRDILKITELTNLIREYENGQARPPLRELLMTEPQHLANLSQAIHDALASTVTDRIESNAIRKEFGQRVQRHTDRATKRLKQESNTDPLTGLGNRRVLDIALDKLLNPHAPSCKSLAVLAIDLDNLKTINDRLGHEVGDACLTFLGSILLSSLREHDVAVRIGGDEFIVIAPGQSQDIARRIAERIQGLFRQMPWPHPPLERPSLSIGVMVTRSPDRLLDRAGLLKAADEALYESKSRGRDLITMHSKNSEAA